MNIRSKGPGRDMLMGALLARAQQLREQTPQMKARLFAQVSPQDTAMLSFYMESGFDANDALDVVKLGVPNARPAAPMGYDMGYVPLQNPADQQGFLMRMNAFILKKPEEMELRIILFPIGDEIFPLFILEKIARSKPVIDTL